jgi:hypothetical protein
VKTMWEPGQNETIVQSRKHSSGLCTSKEDGMLNVSVESQ